MSYSLVIIFSLLWATAFYGVYLRIRKSRSALTVDALAASLVPGLILILCFLFADRIEASIFHYHNWNRLQKTFLLASGQPLYYLLHEGPVIANLYGPWVAISFLPAALTKDPMLAMKIAEIMNLLYFFLPAAFFVFGRPLLIQKKITALHTALFFLFCSMPHLCSPLREAAFNIHADAVTLGFYATACFFTILYAERKRGAFLWSAAFFAVSAVWAKQVAVPVMISLPLYLWATNGRKPALQMAAALFCLGGLMSVFFIALFGYEELFVNMFYIPSHQSFRDGGALGVWMKSAFKLLRECLLITGAGILMTWRQWHRNTGQSAGGWLAERPWMLLVINALLMVPLCLISNVKLGGSNNTLSYTPYLLMLAVVFAGACGIEKKPNPMAEVFIKRSLLILTCLLSLVLTGVVYGRLFTTGEKQNFAIIAYDYAKKHPGQTYFPTIPLIHYFSEGEIYHDAIGLVDRDWAGVKISEEHLRAHLPQDLQLMAFPKVSDNLIRWYPLDEFPLGAKDADLPGFHVYRKYDSGKDGGFTEKTWQEHAWFKPLVPGKETSGGSA